MKDTSNYQPTYELAQEISDFIQEKVDIKDLSARIIVVPALTMVIEEMVRVTIQKHRHEDIYKKMFEHFNRGETNG